MCLSDIIRTHPISNIRYLRYRSSGSTCGHRPFTDENAGNVVPVYARGTPSTRAMVSILNHAQGSFPEALIRDMIRLCCLHQESSSLLDKQPRQPCVEICTSTVHGLLSRFLAFSRSVGYCQPQTWTEPGRIASELVCCRAFISVSPTHNPTLFINCETMGGSDELTRSLDLNSSSISRKSSTPRHQEVCPPRSLKLLPMLGVPSLPFLPPGPRLPNPLNSTL